MTDGGFAKRLWQLFEPYHAVTYFCEESREAFKRSGLRGFWMGYFAGRSAPMGPAGPGLVVATFYNFAPRMVRHAIPDAWSFASAEEVLEARLVGVDAVLRRMFEGAVASPEIAEAAALAEQAVMEADGAGRPLFAANAGLCVPTEPHLRLWWATTCLREHRGDGHNALLLESGVDGCEAHVTLSATGVIPRSVLQDNRGWTDEEWSDASERLRERGWLNEEGSLTAAGREVRRQIENDTDRLAAEPWWRLGETASRRLADLLEPFAQHILSTGEIPTHNPTGHSSRPS
jgi:hypothetical protein